MECEIKYGEHRLVGAHSQHRPVPGPDATESQGSTLSLTRPPDEGSACIVGNNPQLQKHNSDEGSACIVGGETRTQENSVEHNSNKRSYRDSVESREHMPPQGQQLLDVDQPTKKHLGELTQAPAPGYSVPQESLQQACAYSPEHQVVPPSGEMSWAHSGATSAVRRGPGGGVVHLSPWT